MKVALTFFLAFLVFAFVIGLAVHARYYRDDGRIALVIPANDPARKCP